MMKSSKSTTAHSSASTSGTRRLQPLRTTRNNSSRVSTAGVRSHASKTSLGTGPTEAPIEIFPAITHFADAISALPKEIVRHFTLLKEVDAKIFLPEEELMKLVNEALNAPLPPRSQIGETQSCHGQSLNPKNTHGNISGSYINGHGISTVDPDAVWDPSNISRRQLFNKCALTMQGMLVSLDEKNHVISTAGEALAKQLVRIDDCLPFIELEVSEEARNGSTTHWAYPENRISKANSNGNLRREPPSNQSSTGAQNLADEAAARSDARKQAILEKKKSKNLHVDSDFDDQFESKNKDKKTNPKARKQADTQAGLAASTINGSTPNGNSSKRRKVEKTSAQSPAIERSANSNPNINGIVFKGKPASPKSTPQPEGTRKRPRTTQTSSSGPLNKKRNNIEVSGAKSPPLDSSPVQTNFPNSQAISKTSPPPISSRPSSARCSQNSIQRNLDKQPPSPSHNKLSNDLTPDSNSNKVMTASSLSEAKAPSKKVNTSGKSDRSTENVEQREAKISDSIALSSKGNPPPKRDLLDGKVEIHPALSTPTITTTKSGRTSKPSTPATPIFPEFTRPRASRNLDTSVGKRSHKKGAGVATQQFPSHYTGVDDTGKKDNEISEDADIDANEPRYCYCNNVSYGEMVGCDSERCKREWFHLACVGLKTAPRGNTKWYCEDCKLL